MLFQLHPGIVYTPENLERICDALDPAFTNVIEFRHESWWNDEVLKVLRRCNIAFCSISYPGLPDSVLKTSPVVYYRFHGVPELYRSSYSEKELGHVATTIRDLRGVKDVYAYFNNDIDVAAVFNARKFSELASETRQARPVGSV